MKLGQDLDVQELEALHALFGLQALSLSGSDEVRIFFARFFRDMAPAAQEDWIDELHRCLGLSRSDETHEKHCNRQAVKLVLERLRLAFPELGAVHRLLAGQVQAGGLITCENETPFARMIREGRTEVLLYTSGFPNEAVLSLYRLIAPQAGHCRHWGDSDLAGLRIAAMLHAVFPLRLWRCDLPSLERHRKCLIALSGEQ